MPDKEHKYALRVRWTGNRGTGTTSYRGYDRTHDISAVGKQLITGSSDPSFRGDPTLWNPEELLLASLSACHQLWYLGECAAAGVNVIAYEDEAEGVMLEESDGAGQFVSVTLRPRVTISPSSDAALASALHTKAHANCFVARSMNFPVRHESSTIKGVI